MLSVLTNTILKTCIRRSVSKTQVLKYLKSDNSSKSFNRFTGVTSRYVHNHPPWYTKDESKPEDHLEKLVSVLWADIHQKNRIYKSDFLKVLSKVTQDNHSTHRQGLLLIRCCSELLPDEPPLTRIALVEKVWNTLRSHTNFDVEHYNELLRCYIANEKSVNASTFLSQMAPIKPSELTYQLLLAALCEAGDMNQAVEIISNMKAAGIPATEVVFNSLIVGQGKSKNLQNVDEVLTMMSQLNIKKTSDTYIALIRAYIYNDKMDLVKKQFDDACSNGCSFTEQQIMAVVKTLAFQGKTSMVPIALSFLPREILQSPSITPYMQSVCTQLVHQNQPLAALELYKCLPLPSFGPRDDQGIHGRTLVRECVKASMTTNIIYMISQELMKSGRNPLALQSACAAALQYGKTPLAIDLMLKMQKMNIPVRSHYFWPIFLVESRSYGEKGIMETIKTMLSMSVEMDYETLMEFVMPKVSFSSPQNLMKKFQACGLSTATCLTPMMTTLLNMGQVRAASEICELFEGNMDSDKLMKPLIQGFIIDQDYESLAYILGQLQTRSFQKNKDWIGRFLCDLLQHRKMKEDLSDFLMILKELKKKDLKISSSTSDICTSKIANNKCDSVFKGEIQEALGKITDEKLIDESEEALTFIPHPRDMDATSLWAHTVELESKGMNTRGALRRLLQLHCRQGDMKRAKEVLRKIQTEGVDLSPGMKASVIDLHVKCEDLEAAELAFVDLQKSSPSFTLDVFKLIDYATLLVKRDRFQNACEVINEYSKAKHVLAGKGIEGNCWKLLNTTAIHSTPHNTKNMFKLLMQHGYCKLNNILLGPLVRSYLQSGDLEGAVKEFVEVSNKYRKTPLKHELLCEILQRMKDNIEQNSALKESQNPKLYSVVQTILDVNRKLHGEADTQITLVAALAEMGDKKSLRKIFLDPNVNVTQELLMKRCHRLAEEGKLEALELIAECTRDLRHIAGEQIYQTILKVHELNNDCQKAVQLWYRMQEVEVSPSPKFAETLVTLLKANNETIPTDLLSHLDQTSRSQLIS